MHQYQEPTLLQRLRLFVLLLIARAWELLQKRDTEPVEAIASYVSLAFGLWLALPSPAFATMPGLTMLADITRGHETVAGAILLLFGIAQLLATLADAKEIRKALAIVGWLGWFVLWFSILVSNPSSIFVYFFPVCWAANCVVWLRLAFGFVRDWNDD